MSRVLVTGASGFVGRHVAEELTKNGYDIHAISRQEQAGNNSITWHQGDLFDPKQVEIVFRKIRPQLLIHLAWEAMPGNYVRSLENYKWVEASLSLLRLFHQYGGQRAVIAGSCAEYIWGPDVLEEHSEFLSYDSPYAACKNYTRSLSFHFSKQTSLSIAWGRLFFMYGPYESGKRLVSSVITSLLADEQAQCSEGTQKRDFLYVGDAAAAIVVLLNSNETGTFNIASGEAVEVRSIINGISKRLGKSDLVRFGAVAGENGPKRVQGDNSRLGALGWSPKVNLKEGLDRTIQWWKNELT